MGAFIQGFTIGLAYVMPIGAQNIFVINTALTHRSGYRRLTSLIVIFFDVTISLMCFYGVGTIMETNKWLRFIVLGAFRISLPPASGILFISGVCLASVTWWVVMPAVVSLFKSKINDRIFRGINIICGSIIMIYGVKLLISFIGLCKEMF